MQLISPWPPSSSPGIPVSPARRLPPVAAGIETAAVPRFETAGVQMPPPGSVPHVTVGNYFGQPLVISTEWRQFQDLLSALNTGFTQVVNAIRNNR